MLKKVSLLLSIVALMMFTSCGSKMKGLSPDYFTVTPQVLEVVGGEVPVVISGKFPEKYFNKKAILSVTPILKWEGGSEKAESMTFQGEKVQGNNRTISYKQGGNFTLKTKFDYIPAMAKSSLYLAMTVQVGKKVYLLPEVKIADGCIATSELYRSTVKDANTALGEDAFQRVIKQAKEANIMFLIQQTNLRTSELGTTNIKGLKDAMVDVATDVNNKVLDNVEVAAYASPDGGMLLNTDVAGGREKNTAKFVDEQMKKAKLKGYLDTDYTAEDWDGFQALVSQSNLPDKDLILRVLSMYKEPEERELQIKNISSVYKDLADEILPQLRRSRITLNYQLIGRSDDEIMEQLAADPKILSLEEMLYAATLVDQTERQEEIYTITSKLFPNDYRAFNNLAIMAYAKGDYQRAKSLLETAVKKDPAAPEVNVNLGYLALLSGNASAAEAYMAKGAGAKAGDEALGSLYIAQGQYARAAVLLEGVKTNSTVLAQILCKDYNSAKTTLTEIANPNATTYYLMAVLGARTDNASLLNDGIKNAVKADSKLASKFADDLEFAKYATSPSFQSLLK